MSAKMLDLTRQYSEIIFKPLPPDDPSQCRPDITPAKEELACFPKISSEEGLRKTIGHFKAFSEKD